jgi:hypothetical protein
MEFIDEIDFAEIGEDLERFQEDDTVQQALHRGVDLKKYGRDLERELKQVSYSLNIEATYISYSVHIFIG